MNFYIKEWPNKTATLMSDNGIVLWTFTNVDTALQVCKEWYGFHENRHEEHYDNPNIHIGESPAQYCFVV